MRIRYVGNVPVSVELTEPLRLTTSYRYPLAGLTIWTTCSQSVGIAMNERQPRKTHTESQSMKTDSPIGKCENESCCEGTSIGKPSSIGGENEEHKNENKTPRGVFGNHWDFIKRTFEGQ